MARRPFSKPVRAHEERNGPPGDDQGLSTAKPRSSHVTWAISLLMCTNGLRKRSSGHVGPPFLAGRLFSRSVGATIG